MAKYYVDVEHTNTYRIPIEADDAKAASAAVAAMIDDGAMPEDIGEWHDDEINTGSAWIDLRT